MTKQDITALTDWFKNNVFNSFTTDEHVSNVDKSAAKHHDMKPNIIGEKDYVEETGLLEFIIGVS